MKVKPVERQKDARLSTIDDILKASTHSDIVVLNNREDDICPLDRDDFAGRMSMFLLSPTTKKTILLRDRGHKNIGVSVKYNTRTSPDLHPLDHPQSGVASLEGLLITHLSDDRTIDRVWHITDGEMSTGTWESDDEGSALKATFSGRLDLDTPTNSSDVERYLELVTKYRSTLERKIHRDNQIRIADEYVLAKLKWQEQNTSKR
jgi:hypothetical protein